MKKDSKILKSEETLSWGSKFLKLFQHWPIFPNILLCGDWRLSTGENVFEILGVGPLNGGLTPQVTIQCGHQNQLNNYAILIQVFNNIRAQVSWILGFGILNPQTLRIKDPQILIKPTNQQNVQDSGSSILGLSILDPDCKSHYYLFIIQK